MQRDEIVTELQQLQRKRSIVIKSRIMVSNRLQAIIAGTLGYDANLTEKERRKLFTEADKVIKSVVAGKSTHEYEDIIRAAHYGISGDKGFDHIQKTYDKSMVKLAAMLPVAAWVESPEQKGFGMLSLAIVVGECGDFANYSGPMKVWRRLGCAPRTFDGQTFMGATWKSGKQGKLPASEWEEFGYCPRRRSVSYLIGENLVRQNGTIRADDYVDATETATVGPYRFRYEQAKANATAAHTDWSPLRCHRHAMLLATKRLLRNLWCVWNNKPVSQDQNATEWSAADVA